MLKKFLTGSGLFALSVLIFSFVRQIIVLPAIAIESDSLFVNLTFLIFAFEAVAYGFTGAIPDYYVRHTAGGRVNVNLFKKLHLLCLSSLTCFFVFWGLGLELATALLLAIYLYFFSTNALTIKIIFNQLRFSENFIYMIFRVIPYALFLVLIKLPILKIELIKDHEIYMVVTLFLIFEVLYTLRLRYMIRKDLALANNDDTHSIKTLVLALAPFVVGYLGMGFVQRGDLIFVKLLNEEYYLNYAKIMLVIGFFCSPVILMSSTPLLSFMSKYNIEFKSYQFYKLIGMVLMICAFVSILAPFFFEVIFKVIYKQETEITKLLVFFFVLTSLLYGVIRTLAVKYVAPVDMIMANFIVISILCVAIIIFPVTTVVVFFYGFRLVAYGFIVFFRPKLL